MGESQGQDRCPFATSRGGRKVNSVKDAAKAQRRKHSGARAQRRKMAQRRQEGAAAPHVHDEPNALCERTITALTKEQQREKRT